MHILCYDDSILIQKGSNFMKKRMQALTIVIALTCSTAVFTSGCSLSYLAYNLLDSQDSYSVSSTSKNSSFSDSTGESEITRISPEENYAENYYIDDSIHYFFKQLSEEEKQAYSALLTGMMRFDNLINIHISDEDQLSKVTEALFSDHPELFWCDGSYEYISYENYTTVTPTYTYTQSEAGSKRKEIGSVTNAFLASIPAEATEYDKIKAVYDYVITTVSYVDDAEDNQNIYSSMVNKTTVCAGYAREVQYLLQQLDMECLYVFGDIVDGESHAWNIVKCQDQYYHIDATFGDRLEGEFQADEADGISEADYQEFLDALPEEMAVDYGYLCCSDAQLYTDHIPTSLITLPACEATDLLYQARSGRYYESYTDQFWSDMRESVYAGEHIWECQFANEADYQQALSEIENEAYADIVMDYLEDISAYGEYQMWYLNDDALLTISCWY